MPRLPLALVLLTLGGCGAVQEALVERALAGRRAAAGLDAREAVVDGRAVAYLERPGDGPAVVLLHGFGAQKDVWLEFAAALPDSFRVLVPDLAGHGGSARDTAAAYGAGRLADEVGRWLDVVAPGPVHVAGNSLGGQVAALLALRRPARVRSLGLYAPAGVASPQPSTLDSLLAAGRGNPLVPTSRADFDRLVEIAYAEPPDLPGPARDVLAAQAARRAPFLRGLFETLVERRDRLDGRLGEVTQPTLLVWGAEDRVLDPSAAAVWAAGLQGETARVLPGVGHVPVQERPAETAAAYAAFVRRAVP
jgi:pimeloyl-ACP methyl ester carboxylesterase